MIAPTAPRTPSVPAGSHIAIPYQIIYLGTQKTEWKGETKWAHKVNITFEFPNIIGEFENKETKVIEKKPRVLSMRLTHSLGNNSALKPIVEGIVGPLSDEEIKNFDLNTILNKPCMVQVVHKEGYANISAAINLPQGMPVPNLFNPVSILDWNENWSQELYNKQPDFIKKAIIDSTQYESANSPMYSQYLGGAPKQRVERVRPPEENTIDYGESINPEDIPF